MYVCMYMIAVICIARYTEDEPADEFGFVKSEGPSPAAGT